MMGLGLVARDKGIRKKGIITITLLNSFLKIFLFEAHEFWLVYLGTSNSRGQG